MIPKQYENLINFVLLHSYSLTKPGLLFGKSGTALCLFESSRFLECEKLDEYGLELLQEAMASELHDYSFQNGKAGIAWVVNYLIKNQFIDANLKELYGDEIKDIIFHIKSIDKMQANINDCIGFLAFIYMMKDHIVNNDYDYMYQLLISILVDYFKGFPISAINNELFYHYSSIVLGLESKIDDKRFKNDLNPIINSIISKSNSISLDYICNNMSYAVNLYVYGMKKRHNKTICLGKYILDTIKKNILKETLTLKQLIDLSYILEQLRSFENDVSLFYDLSIFANSSIFNMNEDIRQSQWASLKLNDLMSLEMGIPRFIFLNTMKGIRRRDFNKEILMLF